MFTYLPPDSPARLPLKSGYTAGEARAAAAYYQSHSIIQELRIIAGRATKDEAEHYIHVVSGLRTSSKGILSDYMHNHRDLDPKVLQALTELVGSLSFVPSWRIVEDYSDFSDIGAKSGMLLAELYMAKLMVIRMNAGRYNNFWKRINEIANSVNVVSTLARKQV